MKIKAIYLKEGVNPFSAGKKDWKELENDIPLAYQEDMERVRELAREATPEGYQFCSLEPLTNPIGYPH